MCTSGTESSVAVKKSEDVSSHSQVQSSLETSALSQEQESARDVMTGVRPLETTPATTASSTSHRRRGGRTVVLRETREAVEANMPPVYLVGQDIIDSRMAVTTDDDLADDSEEMQDVKMKITMIQSFLSNPMPPFSADAASDAKYAKELESVNLAISMMYNKLVASMDAWLTRGDSLSDYTEERERMIVELKAKVLEEESMFAQCAHEYRARKTGPAFANITETWADMLRYQRAEKIDLDTHPEEVEMGGAGTSEVIKFKRGGKYYYFKQQEDLDSSDLVRLVENIRKKSGAPEELAAPLKAALQRELDVNGRKVTYVRMGEAMEKLESKKDNGATLYTDEKHPLEKLLAECPAEHKDALHRLFISVYKAYNLNLIATTDAGIVPNRNVSRRNVATSRLASLLGIGHLFAESRTAVVRYKNRDLVGNLMEDAKGEKSTAYDDKDDGWYTADACEQLVVMQVFDLLCGQVDRHQGNYMIRTHMDDPNTMIDSVIGIDNDLSFGNLRLEDVRMGRHEIRPLQEAALYALPASFADAVESLHPELMRLILRDLLEPDELDYLAERLDGLQKEIRKTKQQFKAYYEGESAAALADQKATSEERAERILKARIQTDRRIRLYNYLKLLGELDDEAQIKEANGEKSVVFSESFTYMDLDHLSVDDPQQWTDERIEELKRELSIA